MSGTNALACRQAAIADVQQGLIAHPRELMARYQVKKSVAYDWFLEGRGIARMRKVRPPSPMVRPSFRCPACLRLVKSPVCVCTTVINPILAREAMSPDTAAQR